MNKNLNISGLSTVVIAGVLSLIIGSFIISNTFEFYMSDHSISGWSFGKVGLILCELLISLAFSIIGLLLIVLKERIADSRGLLIFLGCFRLFLLLIMLGSFWDPGWYFILDPNGSFVLSYLIVLLSGIQGVAFLFSIKKNTRNVEDLNTELNK